jgi:hypothetical protein
MRMKKRGVQTPRFSFRHFRRIRTRARASPAAAARRCS